MVEERKRAKMHEGRRWPKLDERWEAGQMAREARLRMSHEQTLVASPSGDNIIEHLQMSWVLQVPSVVSFGTQRRVVISCRCPTVGGHLKHLDRNLS